MTQKQTFVDTCLTKYGKLVIPILQDIQKQYRYLPEDALREVAEKLQVPLRDIYGVATFYRSFSLTPKGKHVITVCVGTACHVRGGARIADTFSRELGIQPGETSEDLEFTLEQVNCLGCCAIGPIVVIDGEYHGMVTHQIAISLIRKCKEDQKDDSGKG